MEKLMNSRKCLHPNLNLNFKKILTSSPKIEASPSQPSPPAVGPASLAMGGHLAPWVAGPRPWAAALSCRYALPAWAPLALGTFEPASLYIK